MQSVYSYQDYRKYLEDFYSLKKKKDPLYSYRSFSQTAGIKSPNYLALVIEGSRNLTTANIQQFAFGLKLRPDEIEYFEALVLFNQSKTAAEQSYYKKRLIHLKWNKPEKIQKSSPAEILKEWFSTGILVLAHGRDMEEAIQKCKIELSISEEAIQNTLQKLIELEYLQFNEGKMQISSQQITFHDPKSISLAQESYLYVQVEQSLKAFRRGYKQKKGKFLSQTLTVPPNSIDEIQKAFTSFVENLTQRMDQQVVFGCEELAQINIQIFRPQF
ncbi:MAG TPA: TIGR02147 family protein [Pseudobdellovibrionaceae bacterium]